MALIPATPSTQPDLPTSEPVPSEGDSPLWVPPLDTLESADDEDWLYIRNLGGLELRDQGTRNQVRAAAAAFINNLGSLPEPAQERAREFLTEILDHLTDLDAEQIVYQSGDSKMKSLYTSLQDIANSHTQLSSRGFEGLDAEIAELKRQKEELEQRIAAKTAEKSKRVAEQAKACQSHRSNFKELERKLQEATSAKAASRKRLDQRSAEIGALGLKLFALKSTLP